MRKKTPLIFILIFICIGLTALAIQLPTYINDIALLQFEQQVLGELSFSEEVIFEESIRTCCNSSGTGNHTDLYVAVLVKSTIDEEVLKIAISEIILEDTTSHIHSVVESGDKTLAMEISDISFSHKLGYAEGYYIIEFSKRAPLSWLDLRGA